MPLAGVSHCALSEIEVAVLLRAHRSIQRAWRLRGFGNEPLFCVGRHVLPLS
jgi:hypothetical protein